MYFINNQFIRVRRCCASCARKVNTDGGKRYCNAKKKYVESSCMCELWIVSQSLRRAGWLRNRGPELEDKSVEIAAFRMKYAAEEEMKKTKKSNAERRARIEAHKKLKAKKIA